MEKRPLSVLLIEDSLSDRTLIEAFLKKDEKYSFRVSFADSLSSAEACLKHNPIDIILLDLTLKDSSQEQTLLWIKDQTKPIIVITGNNEEDFVTEVFHHGAQDYLMKSRFNQYLLSRSIIHTLERDHLKAQLDEYRIYHDTFISMQDGISVLDKDFNIILVNPKIKQMYPETDKFIGKKCHEIFQNLDSVCWDCPSAKVKKDGGPHASIISRDSREHPEEQQWVEIVAFPIKDEAQNVMAVIEHVRDITTRKQAEEKIRKANEELRKKEQELRGMVDDLNESHKELKEAQSKLVQSEKLAALGQISAGIAHEINNPLGFIDNNLNILSEYVNTYLEFFSIMKNLKSAIEQNDPDQAAVIIKEIDALEHRTDLDFISNDVKDLLEQSQNGAKRIHKIVLDLKTFVRKDEGQMEIKNIEEIIDGVINIAWTDIEHAAELKKDYGGIPAIRCRPQKLGQAFLNLLLNATESMDQKGTISIKTSADKNHIFIDVADTGRGIPQENITKIFDPFFTTKKVGQGMGLGLSLSYDIIKEHSGQIEVFSEAGKGTTFRITLPLHEKNLTASTGNIGVATE